MLVVLWLTVREFTSVGSGTCVTKRIGLFGKEKAVAVTKRDNQEMMNLGNWIPR